MALCSILIYRQDARICFRLPRTKKAVPAASYMRLADLPWRMERHSHAHVDN